MLATSPFASDLPAGFSDGVSPPLHQPAGFSCADFIRRFTFGGMNGQLAFDWEAAAKKREPGTKLTEMLAESQTPAKKVAFPHLPGKPHRGLLRTKVEQFFRDRHIPYVNVDEARRLTRLDLRNTLYRVYEAFQGLVSRVVGISLYFLIIESYCSSWCCGGHAYPLTDISGSQTLGEKPSFVSREGVCHAIGCFSARLGRPYCSFNNQSCKAIATIIRRTKDCECRPLRH